MTHKEIKKLQFGGWTKRRYKEIRRKVKRLTKKEIDDAGRQGYRENRDTSVNIPTYSAARYYRETLSHQPS